MNHVMRYNSEFLKDDENQTDEMLCQQVANGDRNAEEQLVYRYFRLVKAIARPYFLVGADEEDLIQEGMFGLLKAIRDYSPQRGVPFEAFARLCVSRRIFSALKAARTSKHEPLNNSVSILQPLFGDNAIASSPGNTDSDPEFAVIRREEYEELVHKLSGLLSAFEAKVLDLYLAGYSYEEMSEILGKEVKSVDNAIQRIRRKAAHYFSRRSQG